MSGLCDLSDFPADQWVAIATSVRDSVSKPRAVIAEGDITAAAVHESTGLSFHGAIALSQELPA